MLMIPKSGLMELHRSVTKFGSVLKHALFRLCDKGVLITTCRMLSGLVY